MTDSANKTAITDSYKAIKKIPYVSSAVSPFDQEGAAQISKDKQDGVHLGAAQDRLQRADRGAGAAGDGRRRARQEGRHGRARRGGSIGTVLSPNDTSTSDMIGILAAMLILTFTFGTVVAMGMPIATAILGLTTALGVIGLLGHLIAVPDIAHTVATMIGLAVGIDYALFLVTRHRTQMREGVEMHESVARAVGTAGTAVVFAGCTVVVALVSLVVAGIPLVSALGYTAAVAVGTAVLAAITLLPALMSLAGTFINSIALPARLHPSDDPEKVGHVGTLVELRHPPAVGRRDRAADPAGTADHPGAPRSASARRTSARPSPSTMERKAYDLMASGFGPGYNGPLLIVAVALAPTPRPTRR